MLNDAHKHEFLHELLRKKLIIEHSIDILNGFCSHFREKYDIEMFKSLQTKAPFRVLINYLNEKLQ